MRKLVAVLLTVVALLAMTISSASADGKPMLGIQSSNPVQK